MSVKPFISNKPASAISVDQLIEVRNALSEAGFTIHEVAMLCDREKLRNFKRYVQGKGMFILLH